jgi:hypothetical protein
MREHATRFPEASTQDPVLIGLLPGPTDARRAGTPAPPRACAASAALGIALAR